MAEETEIEKPVAPRASRRARGFESAGTLAREPIRRGGEGRGFAVARLLTQWEEIAGTELAPLARPLRIAYGREGMGATLTLLCSGAVAPLVQMRAETLRSRVNAAYGYNAVARVRITQTAPEGLADAPGLAEPAAPWAAEPPDIARRAAETAAGIGNPDLRAALERLARNVLTREDRKKGQSHER